MIKYEKPKISNLNFEKNAKNNILISRGESTCVGGGTPLSVCTTGSGNEACTPGSSATYDCDSGSGYNGGE